MSIEKVLINQFNSTLILLQIICHILLVDKLYLLRILLCGLNYVLNVNDIVQKCNLLLYNNNIFVFINFIYYVQMFADMGILVSVSDSPIEGRMHLLDFMYFLSKDCNVYCFC